MSHFPCNVILDTCGESYRLGSDGIWLSIDKIGSHSVLGPYGRVKIWKDTNDHVDRRLVHPGIYMYSLLTRNFCFTNSAVCSDYLRKIEYACTRMCYISHRRVFKHSGDETEKQLQPGQYHGCWCPYILIQPVISILYHFISCVISSYCHTIPYTISHHITSHHITSHMIYIISYHIISSHLISYHTTPHHTTPHHTTPHHTTPHHITSHQIMSNHVKSYHI